MAEKLKVAVLFGGQSGEYEVSLRSATSVIHHMDLSKYDLYLIGISKNGKWALFEGDIDKIQTGEWEKEARPVVFPGDPTYRGFIVLDEPHRVYPVDVVFPIMHGPHAEDGTIQGLLELANIPYVGCGVLASSTGMDKGIAKDIFASKNLPQGEYMVIIRNDFEAAPDDFIEKIERKFSYPVFVKPVNMGSSVGISKARNRSELIEGISLAGRYDRKIIIEEFINGREIECAVLGNDHPKASIVGEIIPCNEFYDYNAKYFDDGKSILIIPADLPEEKSEEIRRYAIEAYKALDCSGLSRVDFFVDKVTGRVYINEINTMPGFTSISMYPKLWEATGIAYSELIDTLIELAFERFNSKHFEG